MSFFKWTLFRCDKIICLKAPLYFFFSMRNSTFFGNLVCCILLTFFFEMKFTFLPEKKFFFFLWELVLWWVDFFSLPIRIPVLYVSKILYEYIYKPLNQRLFFSIFVPFPFFSLQQPLALRWSWSLDLIDEVVFVI